MENLKAYRDDSTGRWTLEGVEPEEETFKRMINLLKSNKSFKFARYGDGEINCMNGKVGMNCDQHIYFPDLGTALKETVKQEPEYIVGIQPLSVSHLSESVSKYFGKFSNLVNADVLHNTSIDGNLDKFISALEGRYVILVGPPHLSDFFYDCVHIVIPPLNCWLEYENVRQQIEFHIDGVNNAVVLLCASMSSEVLIHHFKDYPHTFIDVGSVLDPYCNVKSRRYHHKLKV
jgi:hypothetical protein